MTFISIESSDLIKKGIVMDMIEKPKKFTSDTSQNSDYITIIDNSTPSNDTTRNKILKETPSFQSTS